MDGVLRITIFFAGIITGSTDSSQKGAGGRLLAGIGKMSNRPDIRNPAPFILAHEGTGQGME